MDALAVVVLVAVPLLLGTLVWLGWSLLGEVRGLRGDVDAVTQAVDVQTGVVQAELVDVCRVLEEIRDRDDEAVH